LIAAKATFALKAGVWFRRVRFVIWSPDPRPISPSSGRKSTYRPVQILEPSSLGRGNDNLSLAAAQPGRTVQPAFRVKSQKSNRIRLSPPEGG
jgi:hypothetical protein